MDWVEALNRALRYLEARLWEDISSDDIAAAAGFSSFHFQRAFTMLVGMSLGEYLRNRRLSLAGQRLAASDIRVLELALLCGYDTPEGFSKAFSRFHGITPAQAKRPGATLRSFQPLIIKITLEGGSFMDYKIEHMDAFCVLARATSVELETSNQICPRLWDEHFRDGWGETICGIYGICTNYDRAAKTMQYLIADPCSPDAPVPAGCERFTIPAGTWAKFQCVGAMPASIQNAWAKVYSEWLPNSDYRLDEENCDIEMYICGDTSSPDYREELWVKICKK